MASPALIKFSALLIFCTAVQAQPNYDDLGEPIQCEGQSPGFCECMRPVTVTMGDPIICYFFFFFFFFFFNGKKILNSIRLILRVSSKKGKVSGNVQDSNNYEV